MKILMAIILATVITLVSGCDSGDTRTLRGTIEILPKNLNGTWIVESVERDNKDQSKSLITVTPHTRVEGQGPVRAGAYVEITGRDNGRYLLASHIRVEPPDMQTRGEAK